MVEAEPRCNRKENVDMGTLKMLKKATGLALVLSAMAGTAFAGALPPNVSPASVPEIDPGSILSAVTLLCGGFLMLTDRRRAK
jgi:hypothetical protein